MLKYILVCSVIYIILAVISVIMIVREVKKANNKEDMTLIIISFLVPLIGLIIYAVNVGKDKHITECALKGLKMYLKFLVAQFIISLIIILIIIFLLTPITTTVKGHRTSNYTKEVDIQETISKIPSKIQSNLYINSVDVKVQMKITYINIEFVEGVSQELAKSVTEDTLDYFGDDYLSKYDMQYTLTSVDNAIFLQCSKSSTRKNLSWAK